MAAKVAKTVKATVQKKKKKKKLKPPKDPVASKFKMPAVVVPNLSRLRLSARKSCRPSAIAKKVGEKYAMDVVESASFRPEHLWEVLKDMEENMPDEERGDEGWEPGPSSNPVP